VKETALLIKCSKETAARFRVLHARLGLRDHEETLKYLLNLAERYLIEARVY
jgi:hypothetical protein